MPNPYLQDQANAITQQATQNLNNNILPGINAGAMAAGGFGGSRQGIAQGLAIGQTNQGITNSLAGMYGQAYDGDQNRASQQAMQQAQLAAQQQQLQAQLAAQAQQQAAQLAAQQQIAAMQNATTRDLGFGNLNLGITQAANQYALGQGNLANQVQATQNAYSLGQGNLAAQNQANQNSYSLGLGNLANQQQATQNSYDLGLGNLGLNSQVAQQNFYTAQRGQDLNQLTVGAQLAAQGNQGLLAQGQQLYGLGLNQFQAPYNALNLYGAALQPYANLGSTQTANTSKPSTLTDKAKDAVTGADALTNLWDLLTKSSPGNVVYQN